MSGLQTIIDKLWSTHEIARREDGAALLWVDRHYVHEGSFLDTGPSCPNLNPVEESEMLRHKAAAAKELGKDVEAAKKAFVAEQIDKMIAAGTKPEQARATAEHWAKGTLLRPGVVLAFDDPALGEKSVADVLADPDSFDQATLADIS